MANSYGQFTLRVGVSNILESEPSCTSHNLRASFQRWQVHRGLVHGICPHAATQSYVDSTPPAWLWRLQVSALMFFILEQGWARERGWCTGGTGGGGGTVQRRPARMFTSFMESVRWAQHQLCSSSMLTYIHNVMNTKNSEKEPTMIGSGEKM